MLKLTNIYVFDYVLTIVRKFCHGTKYKKGKCDFFFFYL